MEEERIRSETEQRRMETESQAENNVRAGVSETSTEGGIRRYE